MTDKKMILLEKLYNILEEINYHNKHILDSYTGDNFAIAAGILIEQKIDFPLEIHLTDRYIILNDPLNKYKSRIKKAVSTDVKSCQVGR